MFVPLQDQDRSRWDRARIERGLMHLARPATGDHMSRWQLEAGIACEHAVAPSIQKTGGDRIAGFYQVLARQSGSPIVALNRALALAERDGIDAGRGELIALAGERKLSRYPFYWAARADLERRAGCHTAARENYSRAVALARSPAKRVSFERRIHNVVTAVTELKQEDGGDLMMYGYGRLSQTLLARHLVDEIRFSVHPALARLAGGGAAGGGNGKTLPLKLLGATPAPSGVVALAYQPASS